jgi:hypothetical protein
MIGVPELTRARIGNAIESGTSRRAPIGAEDWLPDHEHAKIRVAILFQKLSDCGGPPQTGGSSGRDEQQETRAGRRRVKCGRKLAGAARREPGERMLPSRDRCAKPKIGPECESSGGADQRDPEGKPVHPRRPL